MISIDRKKFILDYLQQNETVTSSVLVQALDVTAMTIGRDLKQLEEKGLLVRTHGGAMLPNYIVEETSYAKKKVRDIEVKRRIAEAALRQIRPGMTIFFDAGTTTFEIADRLKKAAPANITVVTNDLHIGAHLYSQTEIRTVLLGGVVLPETGAVAGAMATEQLVRYGIDLAFVGTSAVTEDFFLVVPTESKCVFKRKLLEISEVSILVADRSKFRKKKLYKAAHMSELDRVITDYPFTKTEVKKAMPRGGIIAI